MPKRGEKLYQNGKQGKGANYYFSKKQKTHLTSEEHKESFSNHHDDYSRINYLFMHNSERHRIKECEISQRDVSDNFTVHLKLLTI